jgi:hypothetical protein
MNARDRSRVDQELAPAARILSPSPEATNGVSSPRGGRRGLLVLTAGLVPYFYGRCPTGRWPRLYLIQRAGVLALFLSAWTHQRDGKA